MHVTLTTTKFSFGLFKKKKVLWLLLVFRVICASECFSRLQTI